MISIKTKLQLALFSMTITLHFSPITSQNESHFCFNNGNYTSESSYRTNLNALLASLSSNIADNGFYNASVGEAYAVALCRADVQLSTCRGCITAVAGDLQQQCPDQYQAIIWHEFCTLRYSNEPIIGTLATNPLRILYNSVNNLRSPQARGVLIDDLRAQAARGGPLLKAAAGKRAAASNQVIYGLVQCTPDLSPEDCASCLAEAAGDIPVCCDASVGVRVYMPSSNIRYEVYNFYNLTRLQEVTSSSPGGDHKMKIIIIIVVSVVAFITLVFFVGSSFLRKRKKHKTKKYTKVGEHGVQIPSTVESIQYNFEKIKAATNNFSDAMKLGQGGFGAVYKGEFENGRKIAVKRLSMDSGQGDLEFKTEVLILARLQHNNLVRLLGFSIQGNERLLVYEFVQNGSLDHFLFDRSVNSSTLNWDTRYKIIRGIAKGLVYLHEDSRLRIVHRDLKASNVLLDGNMIPKIADFGLAKLVLRDATQETSRIIGTYGYMAPEYANHGRFSFKSDMYSFGVVVLEIVSGQKRFPNGATPRDLLNYAWRNWREGTIANIIDPFLMAASGGAQPDMLRCIQISLLCVQENPDDRPTVASVVQMLSTSSSL